MNFNKYKENRSIISNKYQQFLYTPQVIMKEYNGCSVLRYIRTCCVQGRIFMLRWNMGKESQVDISQKFLSMLD